MKDIKEIAKWLKSKVKFLEENNDYVGSWLDLDEKYCVALLWEDGWGEEKREDVIQNKSDLNWGLCAGIKVIAEDPEKTPLDEWFYPWSPETGELVCESTGISPQEDFENLAKWLLEEYDGVKNFTPNIDGSLDFDNPKSGTEMTIKPDDEEKEDEVEEGLLSGEKLELSREELTALEVSLYDFLAENGIYPDDGTFSLSDNHLADLKLSLIISGDWKHDHLFTDNLIDAWCKENGLVVAKSESKELDSGDSDWYKAEHVWELMVDTDEKNGSEILTGLKSMFN